MSDQRHKPRITEKADTGGKPLKTILSLCLLLCIQVQAASPEPTHSTRGMVVSRSTLASQAGIDILQSGGNAIDAAVATGFALAVTYPSAGNLGGGGFAVIQLHDGTVITLDHRETAPSLASKDMYLDENGAIIQGMSRQTRASSGIPGSVDGLLTLLERYGTKSRREILAPAIKLASEGFMLSYDMAGQFNRIAGSMQNYPASIKKFTRNGTPYSAGDIWKQPDLARTLKLISAKGKDGFYKGKVAELIVAEMQKGNGMISLEDLAGYRSVWREPVKGTYRGYDIWGMPPPSSGGILIVNMLNMLEPYDLGSMGWGSARMIHLMVEAERRAYADRAEYLGDPDFYQVPMSMLTSRQYARTRFSDFNEHRASDSSQIGPGNWPEESMETTHFSVLDAAGNAVALTTTLNSGFGNRIVVAGAGFLLNNEMDDFSIKEDTANQYGLLGREANAIEPGKRMLSSMSPTIVSKDGKPYLITGSPGGSTIITTVLQVIVNVIDHNMSIEDAVALPRFHHQWEPDSIMYEPYAISPDTLDILQQMGHKGFRSFTFGRGIGDANSIMAKDGELLGIKDPRNEGIAVGY
jgi:gamma-glutamyltranspeptidase/glutathione hydrolase